MADETLPTDHRDQDLDAVIGAYLEAVDAGQEPDRQELLAQHPDLAKELAEFFADHDRAKGLVGPMLPGPAVPATPPTQQRQAAPPTVQPDEKVMSPTFPSAE